MSRNIWVTSDTHYNHAAILGFVDYQGQRVRDFASVEEMNECLLDSWNSVVKPGDLVYHLGDVFMGDKDTFERDWPKFNGSKRLVFGNHDDPKYLMRGSFFQKGGMWRMFAEHNILATHTCQHPLGLFRGKDLEKPMLNVHGHIHRLDSPIGPYFNISVEKTNYVPMHIEEIGAIAKDYRDNKWAADNAAHFHITPPERRTF